MELPTKTIGRPFTAETHWARFRRLQRTAGKVMGGLPYAKGVQRFRSVEDSDPWQMEQRLKRPGPPEDRDLIALCRELNAQGAKYLVVGGMAVIQQGFLRATEDIELLVQRSEANRQAIVRALEMLPGKSAREITELDFKSSRTAVPAGCGKPAWTQRHCSAPPASASGSDQRVTLFLRYRACSEQRSAG